MTPPTDPWADDCLDRKRFGELLLACLQGEAVFSDEAFVVALTGKFGSGKSHFLRMWRDDLAQKAKEEPESFPLVVTVNAWESDFSGEPLLALVSEISSQLARTQKGKQDKAIAEMKRGVAGILAGAKQLGAELAAGYMEEKTGVPIEGAAKAFTDAGAPGEMDRRAKALFANFDSRKKSLENLRVSLGRFIESRSKVGGDKELKLVLIVDELDRCDPRYAIEFLEAIKHVFNVKGLAVVLGVDWDQLGCTARALFGGELDVEEYFRKFIKRKVPLRPANQQQAVKLGRRWVDRYFSVESAGQQAWKSIGSQDPGKLLSQILISLDLSPRHFQGVFHLLSSFYQLEWQEHQFSCTRDDYVIEFFVAGLFFKRGDLLEEIARGNSEVSIMKGIRTLDLAPKLTKAGLNGGYVEGILIGSLRTNDNYDTFEKLVREAGYSVAEGEADRGDGGSHHHSFTRALRASRGSDVSSLQRIAREMSNLGIFDD